VPAQITGARPDAARGRRHKTPTNSAACQFEGSATFVINSRQAPR